MPRTTPSPAEGVFLLSTERRILSGGAFFIEKKYIYLLLDMSARNRCRFIRNIIKQLYMKFVVSSTLLLSHLQTVGRVINSKNSMPILDNFLFALEGNELTITASDQETTMTTTIGLIEDGRKRPVCRVCENSARSPARVARTTFDIPNQ